MVSMQVYDKNGNPSGISLEEAVLRERPDLRDLPNRKTITPGQGQKGYVIFIGSDATGYEVFKSPRSANPKSEAMQDFNTENYYMDVLKGAGLPVPEITTKGKDYFFVGFNMIPGEEMPYAGQLSKAEGETLAKELIDFVINFANALPVQGNKFAIHDDLWNANVMVNSKLHLSGVIDLGKVAYVTADQWKPMFDFGGTLFYKQMQEEFNRRRGDLPTAKPAATAKAAATVKSGISAIKSVLKPA